MLLIFIQNFLIQCFLMAVVDVKTKLVIGFQTRKKFSLPCELGEIYNGVSILGVKNKYNGVYQIRHGKKKQITVRMKYSAPTLDYSEKTVNARNKWRSGMLAWSELSISEKNIYRQRAKKLKMYGSNLFMREYMLS